METAQSSASAPGQTVKTDDVNASFLFTFFPSDSRHEGISDATNPMFPKMRTAIELKNAIDKVHFVKEIGSCPSRAQKFCDYWSVQSELAETLCSGKADIQVRDFLPFDLAFSDII
jgi:hypothetical protein